MTIAELEEALKEEARVFLNRAQGLRTPHTEDLFQRRAYIGPEDLVVENYLRRRPLAAFNPGAALEGDILHLFPRLVFDYYSYASAIGHAALPLKDLLAGQVEGPIGVRIVLYPTEIFEAVRGCEDARAHRTPQGFALFYTAVGKMGDTRNTDNKDVYTATLALAELDQELKLLRKDLVRVSLSRENTGTSPTGTASPGSPRKGSSSASPTTSSPPRGFTRPTATAPSPSTATASSSMGRSSSGWGGWGTTPWGPSARLWRRS